MGTFLSVSGCQPTPSPRGQGATPAEAIPCQEYDEGTKELGAVDNAKDRLWCEIEFDYRGIGTTNAIPIAGCVVCTSSFSGREPAGGYMKKWATFGIRRAALLALAKRVGLAIGNRNTGLTVVRSVLVPRNLNKAVERRATLLFSRCCHIYVHKAFIFQ